MIPGSAQSPREARGAPTGATPFRPATAVRAHIAGYCSLFAGSLRGCRLTGSPFSSLSSAYEPRFCRGAAIPAADFLLRMGTRVRVEKRPENKEHEHEHEPRIVEDAEVPSVSLTRG